MWHKTVEGRNELYKELEDYVERNWLSKEFNRFEMMEMKVKEAGLYCQTNTMIFGKKAR